MLEIINYTIQIIITILGFIFSYKEFKKALVSKHWLRFTGILLIPVLTLFSILFTYLLGVEQSQITNELSTKLKVTEQELTTTKKFEYISKLTPTGSEQLFFPAISPSVSFIPKGLPEILLGTYDINERSDIFYKCDNESQKKYVKAIDFNPDFPFSYLAIAFCMKEYNPKKALGYAIKANEILEITTKIGGHDANHDTAKSILTNLLKELSDKK
jgi:hypothetical protein